MTTKDGESRIQAKMVASPASNRPRTWLIHVHLDPSLLIILRPLIRMRRTLHCTCSGGHVCYAPVYPRGRIAGGQDLAGQCTTLSSPHGSSLWTFTGWQSSGKLSQTSVVAEATYIRFECLLLFFRSGCTESYWRCSCAERARPLNLLWKRVLKMALVIGKFNLV